MYTLAKSVWATATIAALGAFLFACGSESQGASEPSGEDEATSATTKAPALPALVTSSMLGQWKLASKSPDWTRPSCDSGDVCVKSGANSGDVTEGGSKGPYVIVTCGKDLRYLDTSPFTNVGGGRDCESVEQGPRASLTICHETVFKAERLIHELTIIAFEHGSKEPTGTEKSTTELFLKGEQLHYIQTIRGETTQEYVFDRASK